MRLLRSNKMRETGWSPIYYERGFLRRVVLSKKLLLHGEICDENVTHNGEAVYCLRFREFVYTRSVDIKLA